MLDKAKRLAKGLSEQQIKDLESPLMLAGAGVFCIVVELFIKQAPGALVYAAILIPYGIAEVARVVYIPSDRRVKWALYGLFGTAFVLTALIFTPVIVMVLAFAALVTGASLLWRRHLRERENEQV